MKKLLIVLAALLLAGCATGGPRTLDGVPVITLDEVVSGDVAVAIYWASWCEYCGRLLTEASRADVEIVAINVGDSAEDVYNYMRVRRFDFINLVGGSPPSVGLPYTKIMLRESVGWVVLHQFAGYIPGQLLSLLAPMSGFGRGTGGNG